MKICPKCGAENKDSANFCGECGAKLPDPIPEKIVAETVKKPASLKDEPQLNIMDLKKESAEAVEPEEKKEVKSSLSDNAEDKKPSVAQNEEQTPQPQLQQKEKTDAPLSAKEEKEKKKLEKKAAEKEELRKYKEEMKKLPRGFRPLGLWRYFLLEFLYLIVPAAASFALLYFFGSTASNVLYDLMILVCPILMLAFLLIGAFASRNINVRNFTRSILWMVVLLVIVILILWVAGILPQLSGMFVFKSVF